jgi:predicted methyltransferase
VRPLLAARAEGAANCLSSPDLGRSSIEAALDASGARLGDEWLSWALAEEISVSETSCFLLSDGEARKIQAFSEDTGRVYSLYPTAGAPTMLVSGVPMHRIKGIDPLEDTRRKVQTIAPLGARVLDTATGLGYTAIEASRSGSRVLTVELDPTATEIARLNPWSRELFDDQRIERRIEDSAELIQELADASFDSVIHDPPVLSLAGELYSAEFYRQLYRVLVRGGKLFHYVGDPDSKSAGNVTRGVARRLAEAGFGEVKRRPEAFGVSARKL